MTQLDRIEGKVDGLGKRLASVETWKSEMDGARKALRAAWTLLVAVAAVAGWVIAHFHLLGVTS